MSIMLSLRYKQFPLLLGLTWCSYCHIFCHSTPCMSFMSTKLEWNKRLDADDGLLFWFLTLSLSLSYLAGAGLQYSLLAPSVRSKVDYVCVQMGSTFCWSTMWNLYLTCCAALLLQSIPSHTHWWFQTLNKKDVALHSNPCTKFRSPQTTSVSLSAHLDIGQTCLDFSTSIFQPVQLLFSVQLALHWGGFDTWFMLH